MIKNPKNGKRTRKRGEKGRGGGGRDRIKREMLLSSRNSMSRLFLEIQSNLMGRGNVTLRWETMQFEIVRD